MKILILLYLFGLPFCYAQTAREIEIKKIDEKYEAIKAARLVERKKRDEEYEAKKAERDIERKKRDEEYEARKAARVLESKKRDEINEEKKAERLLEKKNAVTQTARETESSGEDAKLAREVDYKKQKELRAENDIKKKEEYEKKKIVREKMNIEAKLKWDQEENRIRSMYSNDLNKSKISRVSVTTRLIVGIKAGLSVYKMSWVIGGKKGVLGFIEKQKAKNANAGTYNYSFGRMNGDESCSSLLEINTRSALSSDETSALASKFPCELSDDKFKVYAFARFKENNKLDIWSMDENSLFEHIQDGFDPGLTK